MAHLEARQYKNSCVSTDPKQTDEIQDEDGIKFHDEFKKGLATLEASGTLALSPGYPLKSKIATFLAENYTPKEAGRVMCPACLFGLLGNWEWSKQTADYEIPHDFTICRRQRNPRELPIEDPN